MATKPNMREFMDATGVDAGTASELLYGVVGANRDTRDWSSIMSASDPVAAASQATGAMYASPEATRDTLASGRYATIAPSSGAPSLVRYSTDGQDMFALVAADGTPLRAGFRSEDQARAQGRLFGITGDVATGQYVAPRIPEVAQAAQMPGASQAAQTPMSLAAPAASQALPMFASETLARPMAAQPMATQPTAAQPMVPQPMVVPQFQQPGLPPLASFMQPLPMPPSQFSLEAYGASPMQQGIMSLPPTGLMG